MIYTQKHIQQMSLTAVSKQRNKPFPVIFHWNMSHGTMFSGFNELY